MDLLNWVLVTTRFLSVSSVDLVCLSSLSLSLSLFLFLVSLGLSFFVSLSLCCGLVGLRSVLPPFFLFLPSLIYW